MAKRNTVPIRIASRDNRELTTTLGQITEVEWDRSERIRNALKTFGGLLALAFASVFIPILHFVLVPTLFLGSFVFALDQLSEKVRSEGGTGECPKCHLEFKIQASKNYSRMVQNCDHCHEDLEMLLK